jgi:hypothetical protein
VETVLAPVSVFAQRDSVNLQDGQLVARRGGVACDAWLVFEGFPERAWKVVVYAQEEVRGFGHDHIGTEHILLGLLRQEEGLAARVLEYSASRLSACANR